MEQQQWPFSTTIHKQKPFTKINTKKAVRMPVFRLHKQKHFLPYKENYVFTPDVQFYERPKSDYKKPALSTFTF